MKPGDALPRLELDVTARLIVMGASASRDWQPQHHDHAWATRRAGTKDIFLNTPHQAGLIERYITDWTGPRGRLGRLRFRMRKTVCPGDTLTFDGTIANVETDTTGCRWVDLELALSVDGETATECTARVAVPHDDDNPWARTGDDWRP